MATVFIPTLLSGLTAGQAVVEVPGATVRELIDGLDALFPGLRERLMEDNRLRADLSFAVDGEVTPLGLIEKVGPASEVHFVMAIKGG